MVALCIHTRERQCMASFPNSPVDQVTRDDDIMMLRKARAGKAIAVTCVVRIFYSPDGDELDLEVA